MDDANKFPPGVICDQKPGVGEKVPPGTEVFVYISLGEETGAMPELKGQSAENANSLLQAMNVELTILTDKEYSDDIPEGSVSRTDPEAGTELKNGQVVTVYISMGPENKLVKVPSVVGASLENARTSITAHGLECSVKEEYSDKHRSRGGHGGRGGDHRQGGRLQGQADRHRAKPGRPDPERRGLRPG